MGIKFKMDDFTKKMANDPLSINMKEVEERRILEVAGALHDMIHNGETIKYNHLTLISDAMDKVAGICNGYLLVMQCTGKQNEIPEDVINAIKFIYSFDSEKIMSMLDDESKNMFETMKKFSDIFGKDMGDL